MKNFETNLGLLYNENCITTMNNRIKDESIDCVITSPPYNVGIEYDQYNDNIDDEKYIKNMMHIFYILYFKLKNDGRIALNLPFETYGRKERQFMIGEYWEFLKKIGYKWGGFVRLVEDNMQVAKRISQWGSWLSPSAPYIMNSEECVLILYKNKWKKERKGTSYFTEENKREFIDLVRFGWKYNSEKQGLTKANYSIDLPLSALKILTWQEDFIYDPFMGSGTTALACEMLGRKWIGSELSSQYCEKAKDRIKTYLNPLWKLDIFYN